MSLIQYIRGDNDIVVDCLSQQTYAITVDAFDLHGIARAQRDYLDRQAFNERLVKYGLTRELNLWCDKSTNFP